ncbi:MAG: BatD family protein, partial [Bacteroidales bacterium]|nr:BatD family protein [Bacteroidales bacterium]
MNRFIITLFLVALAALGQAQTLSVQAPSTVGVGQSFSVSFVANGRASDFRGPNFKGFSVLSGPSTSKSSSMSFMNGKMSSSVEYGFGYYVRADQEGIFTIGAASCTVDGKKISSQPFTIQVVKGKTQQSQQKGQQRGLGGEQSQQLGEEQSTKIDASSLYARADISNAHPYQGEQVIITYKIYTQVSLQNFQLDKLPGNKGFWSEDLSEGKQVKTYDETVNGRRYRVAEIRRGAMFAQESGKMRIEPLEMDVLAVVPRQRVRTGTIWDLFDDPFFNSAQAVEKHLATNALSVNVKPLPPSPKGFGGAVGTFNVTAEVDNNHVRANEAVTYRVTITGRGNLPLVQAPEISFPPVFDAYEPQVVDKIQRTDGGVSGSRTFEW